LQSALSAHTYDVLVSVASAAGCCSGGASQAGDDAGTECYHRGNLFTV